MELLLRNSNLLSVRSNDEHFSCKDNGKTAMFFCSEKNGPIFTVWRICCSCERLTDFLCSDAFNSGMCFTFKTIQKTGNLLIRANEGVVYISMWKMF